MKGEKVIVSKHTITYYFPDGTKEGGCLTYPKHPTQKKKSKSEWLIDARKFLSEIGKFHNRCAIMAGKC